MGLLKIEGDRILENGSPIRLRGVNFGNWMLIEHFMIGLPWVEYKMREQFREILGDTAYNRFFDTYMDNYITESDFKCLSQLGCNCIRLPFNYRHFEDDRNPGAYQTQSFAYIDKVVALCRKYDMYVLLDLHAAPGVQARDWNAESAWGEACLWEHPFFVKRTADLWRFIAQRYKNEERVMGYEILNEPLAPNENVFNEFNHACVRAIRQVDSDHIIVIESNEWGKKLSSLDKRLFDDPQVMPSLHHYPSQFAPFDKISCYPGTHNGKRYGREDLRATLDGVFDQSYITRPFLCGEFNHGNTDLLDDLLYIFEEQNIHWTLWSYKSVGPMGLAFPGEHTPWKQFYASDTVTNVRSGYQECVARFAKELGNTVPLASEVDIRHFTGQIGHQWHAVMLPKVLGLLKGVPIDKLESFAKSFAFENCSFDAQKMDILRKHCGG